MIIVNTVINSSRTTGYASPEDIYWRAKPASMEPLIEHARMEISHRRSSGCIRGVPVSVQVFAERVEAGHVRGGDLKIENL